MKAPTRFLVLFISTFLAVGTFCHNVLAQAPEETFHGNVGPEISHCESVDCYNLAFSCCSEEYHEPVTLHRPTHLPLKKQVATFSLFSPSFTRESTTYCSLQPFDDLKPLPSLVGTVVKNE